MFRYLIVIYFYFILLLINKSFGQNVTENELNFTSEANITDNNINNSKVVLDKDLEPKDVEQLGTSTKNLDKSMGAFIDSGLNFLMESRNIFNKELNESKSENEAKDVWIAYSKSFGRLFEALIKFIVPKLLESGTTELDISLDCISAMIDVVNGLKKQKDWAVKLIDSSGRPFAAGSLDGTITSLGAYDQCLEIESDTESSFEFVGQYCILKYQIALPPKSKRLTFRTKIFNFTGTPVHQTFLDEFSVSANAFYSKFGRTGICIPSACNAYDFQLLLKRFVSESHLNLSVNDCHTKELPKLNSLQITIISIFAIILSLMILATSLDLIIVYTKDSNRIRFIRVENPFRKLLLATLLSFSVYKNGKVLFDTNTRSSSSAIECINGIRVLSMIWILWTHTYLIPIKETFTFVRDFMYTVEEVAFQLILNGWVLVDTFFLVGAMLTTYTHFHRMAKNDGQINILQQILNRFFRFWPSVTLTVMLLFVIPSMSSGPLWKEYFDVQLDKCYRNWWPTITFINNWFDESQMCLLHTWYLSADIQLFILSFAFIIPLYKKPSLGIKLIIMGAMASCLAIAIRTFVLMQNPTVLYNTPNERDVYDQASTIYVHTYIHLGPYSVGLILGYIVYKYKTLKIDPLINLLIWMFALLGCLAIMLSTYTLNRGEIWRQSSAAFYAGLHRTAWALCVAWIIFGCTSGNGGPINTFLSWKLFAPLGKLSFMIYLMHFLVIWVRYAYVRQALPFSHYTMFCEFIVNLVISISVSIVTHLAFEAPMVSLYNIYLSNVFKFANIRISKAPKTKTLDNGLNDSAIMVTSKL